MEIIDQGNSVLNLLMGLGVLLAGGAGSFFIIRGQLNKTLKEEVNIYKGKIERMESDLRDLTKVVDKLTLENESLVKEKAYLRGLIMEALTTKNSVNKSILEDVIKGVK